MNTQESSSEFQSTVATTKFIGENKNIYRVLRELDNDDVLKVCRDYYETIKDVVTECEKYF